VQKNAKEYKITPGRTHALKNDMLPFNLAELKDDYFSLLYSLVF
jgi:hypothetical protein